MIRLAPHIAALLEKTGLPRGDWEALEKLPDVQDRYRARLDAMVAERSPADTLKFIIEKLCSAANVLLGAGAGAAPSDPAKVAREFAIQEMQMLLRSEKLYANPIAFTFSMFFDEPDQVPIPEQVGMDGEDILQEAEEKAGEEGLGADNPFDQDNIDFEETEADDNGSNPDFPD